MDAPILALESALRTLFATPRAQRACPTLPELPAVALTDAEKAHAGALMRINHVGEVCAQALYMAQALTTPSANLKAHFTQAAKEEADHLAWTAERLTELGAHPSWLNPLWYGGAFAMGLVAGRLGDALSLGFVEETERQVTAHLQGHLRENLQENLGAHEAANALPTVDLASRAIVAQMRDDEAAHAQEATQLGARELPEFVKAAMTGAARVMTTVAYRV